MLADVEPILWGLKRPWIAHTEILALGTQSFGYRNVENLHLASVKRFGKISKEVRHENLTIKSLIGKQSQDDI